MASTPYTLISANSNNATTLRASPGQITYIAAFNYATTAARHVKFYDETTLPAPASDTPKWVVTIPAAVSATQPSGVIMSRLELEFATGIGFAIVANESATDNTAVGANDVVLNLAYN